MIGGERMVGLLCITVTALMYLQSPILPVDAFGVASTTQSYPPTMKVVGIQPQQRRTTSYISANNDDNASGISPLANDRIDLSVDDRLYRICLPRAPGIGWGTDLSFSFVYVREMEPAGPASLSGLVEKGDQLCELVAVKPNANDDETAPKVENLMGASFDYVMGVFAGLDKTVRDVELVFFRGTKEELKQAAKESGGNAGTVEADTITVTVIENKGSEKEQIRTLQAEQGVNVRQLLVDNGINVYQSVTRWTNCKGKQLCGTCIVNVSDGSIGTNRKSMDEGSTLRENPDSYRLSCVTFAYGDITVETFPPIEAAQWTR